MRVIVQLFLVLPGLACATTTPKSDGAKPPVASSEDRGRAIAATGAADAPGQAPPRPDLSPLRFEFDASLLDLDAQARLQGAAAFLRATPQAKIRIVGHADERGTTEYNLTLGDARARAARDYLVRLGVDAQRIVYESRGEEEPAHAGHDESAWSQNRRGELFLLEG